MKQEEPLKNECQHFLDCIRNGATPLTSGTKGAEVVRILEASSESLRIGGAPVDFLRHQAEPSRNGTHAPRAAEAVAAAR